MTQAGLPAAVRGALWMGGALLSFSLMAVAVRELLRTLAPSRSSSRPCSGRQ